jgi:hypothetical protein
MSDLGSVARILVVAGLCLLVLGGLVALAGQVPFLARLGRLPGDITIRRGNFTLYAPIVTSIILSIVLTIVLNLIFRR